MNEKIAEKDKELHEVCEANSLLFLDCLKDFSKLESKISECRQMIQKFNEDLEDLLKRMIYGKKAKVLKEQAKESIEKVLLYLKQLEECLSMMEKAEEHLRNNKHISATKLLRDLQGRSLFKNGKMTFFNEYAQRKLKAVSSAISAKAKDYLDQWGASLSEKQSEIAKVVDKLIEESGCGAPNQPGGSTLTLTRSRNSLMGQKPEGDRDKALLQRSTLMGGGLRGLGSIGGNRMSMTFNVRETLQHRRSLKRTSSEGYVRSVDRVFRDFKVDFYFLTQYQNILDQIGELPERVANDVHLLRQEQFLRVSSKEGLKLEGLRMFFLGLIAFLFIQKEIEAVYERKETQSFWGATQKMMPGIVRVSLSPVIPLVVSFLR